MELEKDTTITQPTQTVSNGSTEQSTKQNDNKARQDDTQKQPEWDFSVAMSGPLTAMTQNNNMLEHRKSSDDQSSGKLQMKIPIDAADIMPASDLSRKWKGGYNLADLLQHVYNMQCVSHQLDVLPPNQSTTTTTTASAASASAAAQDPVSTPQVSQQSISNIKPQHQQMAPQQQQMTSQQQQITPQHQQMAPQQQQMTSQQQQITPQQQQMAPQQQQMTSQQQQITPQQQQMAPQQQQMTSQQQQITPQQQQMAPQQQQMTASVDAQAMAAQMQLENQVQNAHIQQHLAQQFPFAPGMQPMMNQLPMMWNMVPGAPNPFLPMTGMGMGMGMPAHMPRSSAGMHAQSATTTQSPGKSKRGKKRRRERKEGNGVKEDRGVKNAKTENDGKTTKTNDSDTSKPERKKRKPPSSRPKPGDIPPRTQNWLNCLKDSGVTDIAQFKLESQKEITELVQLEEQWAKLKDGGSDSSKEIVRKLPNRNRKRTALQSIKHDQMRVATTILNDWFYEHFENPYPSRAEKKELQLMTSLTIVQINNWFGNKRVRVKKQLQALAKHGSINSNATDTSTPSTISEEDLLAEIDDDDDDDDDNNDQDNQEVAEQVAEQNDDEEDEEDEEDADEMFASIPRDDKMNEEQSSSTTTTMTTTTTTTTTPITSAPTATEPKTEPGIATDDNAMELENVNQSDDGAPISMRRQQRSRRPKIREDFYE